LYPFTISVFHSHWETHARVLVSLSEEQLSNLTTLEIKFPKYQNHHELNGLIKFPGTRNFFRQLFLGTWMFYELFTLVANFTLTEALDVLKWKYCVSAIPCSVHPNLVLLTHYVRILISCNGHGLGQGQGQGKRKDKDKALSKV
jgi:hypothetical protein